jgi:lysine-N-methylase
LADICASYPRLRQQIDGLPETSLLLSCPEAARLVLLNPNLLPDAPADSARYQRFLQMALKPVPANGSPHQFLWDIREFSLLLVRDRSYSLWQRLFILGMFCKRLNDVTQTEQLGLIPTLLGEYARMTGEGVLRGPMEGIPGQPVRQLTIVLEVINRQLGMTDASHTRFRECVQSFLDGIHFDENAPIETFIPCYQEAHFRYYFPFMQKCPFILENYLVNYIFRTRFPYGVDAEGNPRDPLTECMAMIILFAVIKGLLIGMAGHMGAEFGEDHVVKLVQTFAKAVEQCAKFELGEYMALAHAEGMAVLLKNGE